MTAIDAAARIHDRLRGYDGPEGVYQMVQDAADVIEGFMLRYQYDRPVLNAVDVFLDRIKSEGCQWTSGKEYEDLLEAGRTRRDALDGSHVTHP